MSDGGDYRGDVDTRQNGAPERTSGDSAHARGDVDARQAAANVESLIVDSS